MKFAPYMYGLQKITILQKKKKKKKMKMLHRFKMAAK